jgi:hypothetical protein
MHDESARSVGLTEHAYVLGFQEIDRTDVGRVGGKGASLGQLFQARRHPRAGRLLRFERSLSAGRGRRARKLAKYFGAVEARPCACGRIWGRRGLRDRPGSFARARRDEPKLPLGRPAPQLNAPLQDAAAREGLCQHHRAELDRQSPNAGN